MTSPRAGLKREVPVYQGVVGLLIATETQEQGRLVHVEEILRALGANQLHGIDRQRQAARGPGSQQSLNRATTLIPLPMASDTGVVGMGQDAEPAPRLRAGRLRAPGARVDGLVRAEEGRADGLVPAIGVLMRVELAEVDDPAAGAGYKGILSLADAALWADDAAVAGEVAAEAPSTALTIGHCTQA